MKETLKVKTLPVIILTVILTIACNMFINRMFTQEVKFEEGLYSSRTVHFSLGISGLVFVIPSVLVSILIVRFLMNRVKRPTVSFKSESVFKWHTLYGMTCGGILLFFLIKQVPAYADRISVSNVGEALIHMTVLFLIPIVIAVLCTKLINKIMIRITNTNVRLIREIETGKHNGAFSDLKKKAKVLKLLKKGSVTTLKGGIWRVNISNFLFLTGRTAVFVPLSLLDYSKSQTNQVPQRSTPANSENLEKKHQEKKNLQSEAYYESEQKRKQADFSKKQFIKQANYNIKYSSTELNRARRDQQEYEKAKRKADSL